MIKTGFTRHQFKWNMNSNVSRDQLQKQQSGSRFTTSILENNNKTETKLKQNTYRQSQRKKNDPVLHKDYMLIIYTD